MERQALATFVATVETQLPAEQARRGTARRDEDRRFGLLLASTLTLFAWAVNGYHPYAEDGGLYMAGVKRLLDPALYPRGTSFVLEPMRHSLFAPMVAAVVRLAGLGPTRGLPLVFLGLHLASIWLTLFAAWMLASRCWPGRAARAGAVALLACWLDLPIAGTALLFMDPYVTARSLSTPCMILALVGALDATPREEIEPGDTRRRRGFLLWAGGILLGAAMHPLMAAYALGASLVLMCLRARRRSVRVWDTLALCGSALAIAATLQSVAPAETTEYVRVALTRSYWFLAQWRWYELAGLWAPLGIVGAFAVLNSQAKANAAAQHHISKSRAPVLVLPNDAATALAWMAVAVGGTAALGALMFARTEAATHLVARIQPLRAFQIVYLVMMLALGAKLGERLLRGIKWRWTFALLLLAGPMLLAARVAYPDSSHIELASRMSRNPWVQAFLWVREHTPKGALFALDRDYINAPGEDAQCFRAIAERSALADYSKDGGEASIAPRLTSEWAAGQRAQANLSQETDAQRIATLRPPGATWMVLDTSATTAFDCPYQNEAVKVCRLR
jgi:hypothetical protein